MENNQRYKELKFEGKTYTQKYQINEILLKNDMNWFLDCEMENARIEIMKDTIIFNGGIFYNGVWEYGVIRDGDIRNITFQNGVIYNGTFKKIKMEKGIIFGGTFLRGDILFADIRGGDFKDVNISNNVNQTDKEEKPAQPVQVPAQTQSGQTQAQEPSVQVQGEVKNQDAKQIQSQVQERYIKKFETFLYGENKPKIYETQKKKNEEILKMIFDLDLQYHEGEFLPKTWLRKADLTPDNRNNEIITDFAGTSLSFDTHTSEYNLALPVKFKDSVKDEIEEQIKKDFEFISSNRNDRNVYTRVIKFK